MATFKTAATRLAAFAASSIIMGVALFATPASAFAYYGALPNPTLPSNFACSGRFDPNCIIETSNYLVNQSYASQYSTNYGTTYNPYSSYGSAYYTPNYSNSYSAYNPYSTSYSYSQPTYQYSVPSYNYSYVAPSYSSTAYQYQYNYQYEEQPAQLPYPYYGY